MSEVTVTFTDSGRETVDRMRRNVERVGQTYGELSAEYRAVLESFVNALMTVGRLGGRISRDGELSLYGVSQIHYGIIFHSRDKGRCPACWESWPYGLHVKANPRPGCERCGGTGEVSLTVDDIGNGVAVLGEWSAHS